MEDDLTMKKFQILNLVTNKKNYWRRFILEVVIFSLIVIAIFSRNIIGAISIYLLIIVTLLTVLGVLIDKLPKD